MPATRFPHRCVKCALPLATKISHCPYCGLSRRPGAARQFVTCVLHHPLLVPLIALVLIAGLAEWTVIVKLFA